MQGSFVLVLLATACMPLACDAHWRMTKPVPRVGDGVYENNPLPRDANTKDEWVCRHAEPNPSVQRPTFVAGNVFYLKYGGGATIGHPGDCSVYISYDTAAPRRAMRWVKIANLPDCKEQINQDVPIVLPRGLPGGNAVLRWDEYALHQGTFIEWFIQCADIRITSSSTRSWDSFNSFSIIDNDGVPAYPSDLSRYRSPYRPNQARPSDSGFFMTGPACVDESVNQCALTARGTPGFTGFGGDAQAAPVPFPSPQPPSVPVPQPPYPSYPAPAPSTTGPLPDQDDGECCYSGGCSSYGTSSCNPVGTWCSQSSRNCQSCGGTHCTEMDWWGTQPSQPSQPSEPSLPAPPSGEESQCCYASGCSSFGTEDCNAPGTWCSESQENCERCKGTFCTAPPQPSQPSQPSEPSLPAPPSGEESQCCYASGCSSFGTELCNAPGTWCSESQENCESCKGTFCTAPSLLSKAGPRRFLRRQRHLGPSLAQVDQALKKTLPAEVEEEEEEL